MNGKTVSADQTLREWYQAVLEGPAQTWHLDGGQLRNKRGEVIASFPFTLGDEQDRANARLVCVAPELAASFSWLIGAAQELAEALQGLLSVLENGIEHGDDFEAAVQEGYRALELVTEPPEVPD